MTFYTRFDAFEGLEPESKDLPPSMGEYLGAVAKDAWQDSPMSSLSRMRELNESIYGVVDVGDPDGITPDIDYTPPSTALSVDDQKQRIAESGLEKHLQPSEGYTAEALDIITSRKKAELERKEVREAAPNMWAPLGLATGLGVTLLDPINVASAFFPVVGEARAMALLGKASGAWGRAGVRASIGAAEGAVGAAVVEPLIYAAKTYEQADYDMSDSLMNIGFGAVFGAALQPAAGAVGDFLRMRRGQRNPWEITPPTEGTETLRTQLADDMHAALVNASPDMDRNVADAAAALFDARARTWSHDMGRGVDEYYSRYKPEFANAADKKAVLQQGTAKAEGVESADDLSQEKLTEGLELQEEIAFASTTGEMRQGQSALSGEVESTPEEIMQFFGSDNPRASVTFEDEGRAVIRFFSSVDPTSAPHELYHIFRRELAQTAADGSAPARVREDWRAIEEFVESRPGEDWDVFQEERFAKAGEKFLMEGVAPTPGLQRVFERLKQWFSEVYTQAEAAGIPISEEMRKVFANMMSVEDADTMFRNALGNLQTRDVSREFATDGTVRAETGNADLNAIRGETDHAASLLAEHMSGVAVSDPKLAMSIADEFGPALQQADVEVARTATYREVLREATLCETRR